MYRAIAFEKSMDKERLHEARGVLGVLVAQDVSWKG